MKLLATRGILFASFVFAQAFTQLASADLVNVEALNQKLKKENATWFAKDTSMNQLSRAEAKRMMGLKRRLSPDTQFVDRQGFVKNKALPASVDWRNKDGKNWVSPILNQANCGSCVAFAAVGTLETQVKINSGLPTFNVRLSTQNLFACGGGQCDYGWYPDSAARSLMSRGVPDEACMPYMSGATGQDVACRASCVDTAKRSVKIANYDTPTLTLQNVESVKEALQRGPLMTTLSVYEDFMSYAGGVYEHKAGQYLGGHAVSIIGYDDSVQAYIIRNSWGEEWGEKGFGRVAYSDVSGIGDETWGFSLPNASGGVSVESPRDYTYYSKILPIKASATYAATDSVNVTIYDAKGQSVLNEYCGGRSVCEVPAAVSFLPDGRYEVQAQAMNAKGESIGSSTRQFFYVVNSAPEVSVTMKGHGGLDLSKDLKGRVEFDVTSIVSGAVPLSSMEFHFRGPDGVENVRRAEVVIKNMTVGWRTNLVANGEYEIWMTGKLKTDSIDLASESEHMHVRLKN